MGIRANVLLAFIFRWLNYSGLWIPENTIEYEHSKWPTLLETFSMVYTLIAATFGTYQLLANVEDNSKVVNFSPAIVVFSLYFLALNKTLYLWFRKKSLLDIFKTMDEIAGFSPFAQYQKVVVDFICVNVRKTTLYLIWISMAFITFMLSAFFSLSFSDKITYRRPWKENFVPNMTLFGTDIHYTIQQVALMLGFSLHFFMNYVIQLRNLLMDSLLLLSHYFIVQQLNLLNRLFCHPTSETVKIMHFKSQHLFDPTSKNNCSNFDDWVVLFNKVKRLQNETNSFFGLYCVLLVASAMMNLCFVSFTASKNPTILLITAYVMIAVVLIMQVFSCCKSGQNVKEAADKVTDTVCTGPWQDHALADSLHLIAVDLQRSFTVRGGPFFNLNLEFFASMMGAVFTYYIVLVQMRD